jgi:hypothetical protein
MIDDGVPQGSSLAFLAAGVASRQGLRTPDVLALERMHAIHPRQRLARLLTSALHLAVPLF